ncbi:MAG: TetR/AcrR family transcriptional regulator [Candidatus Dormibacteraeota bacterium]|uniref:TetR/AcrR family transcriptional regulator n=1 Tax=Candidatus Amunia macphersoniae TaxID=3127014 RepID=A0A934KG52_9BACT|nr:TetR/AcrR family transcriptional regulator [Candidatus Dormibacteraeota bacterium]
MTQAGPPPPRLSADQRRDQVIASAIHEFAELGYQAASTAAIARRAGISQPYIYALFPNKQELFLAVHDQVIERIRLTFADAARHGRTPREKLDQMGAAYPSLIADRYALMVQLQVYATGDPVIQAHASRGFRGLYDEVIRLSGAPAAEVSLLFACGMLANVTTALGQQEICAPLFEAKPTTVDQSAR